MSDNNASQELLAFISQYSSLIEKQLVVVRDMMSGTVQAVMQSAQSINAEAEKTSRRVEALIEKAPLPSDQTLANPAEETQLEGSTDQLNAWLSELDQSLHSVIVTAMGALSAEDVLVQRMEHLMLMMKALETCLSYVLLDYPNRGKSSRLNDFMEDLKLFTLSQYTSEDEKEEYRSIFKQTYPKRTA